MTKKILLVVVKLVLLAVLSTALANAQVSFAPVQNYPLNTAPSGQSSAISTAMANRTWPRSVSTVGLSAFL